MFRIVLVLGISGIFRFANRNNVSAPFVTMPRSTARASRLSHARRACFQVVSQGVIQEEDIGYDIAIRHQAEVHREGQ